MEALDLKTHPLVGQLLQDGRVDPKISDSLTQKIVYRAGAVDQFADLSNPRGDGPDDGGDDGPDQGNLEEGNANDPVDDKGDDNGDDDGSGAEQSLSDAEGGGDGPDGKVKAFINKYMYGHFRKFADKHDVIFSFRLDTPELFFTEAADVKRLLEPCVPFAPHLQVVVEAKGLALKYFAAAMDPCKNQESVTDFDPLPMASHSYFEKEKRRVFVRIAHANPAAVEAQEVDIVAPCFQHDHMLLEKLEAVSLCKAGTTVLLNASGPHYNVNTRELLKEAKQPVLFQKRACLNMSAPSICSSGRSLDELGRITAAYGDLYNAHLTQCIDESVGLEDNADEKSLESGHACNEKDCASIPLASLWPFPKNDVAHVETLVSLGLAKRSGDHNEKAELRYYSITSEGIDLATPMIGGGHGKPLEDVPGDNPVKMSNVQLVKHLLKQQWLCLDFSPKGKAPVAATPGCKSGAEKFYCGSPKCAVPICSRSYLMCLVLLDQGKLTKDVPHGESNKFYAEMIRRWKGKGSRVARKVVTKKLEKRNIGIDLPQQPGPPGNGEGGGPDAAPRKARHPTRHPKTFKWGPILFTYKDGAEGRPDSYQVTCPCAKHRLANGTGCKRTLSFRSEDEEAVVLRRLKFWVVNYPSKLTRVDHISWQFDADEINDDEIAAAPQLSDSD